MKSYLCKKLSLRYDVKQDRLHCISHGESGQMVSIWLTRKLLIKLLPSIAEWLNRYSDAAPGALSSKAQSRSERLELQSFEHEAAQHQVSMEYGALSGEIAPEAEFLLYGMRLGVAAGHKLKLIFFDEAAAIEVFIIMTPAEVHKVVGEWLRLSEKANWKIESPWRDQAPMTGQSGSRVVH